LQSLIFLNFDLVLMTIRYYQIVVIQQENNIVSKFRMGTL